MNGLGFIRSKIMNITMEELSLKMNVTKQLIQMWESGKRKIPEKRLLELEKISGIPQKYFRIENLTAREELEIKHIRTKKEVNQIMVDCIEIDEDGKKNLWISDEQLEIFENLEYSEMKIELFDLKEKIERMVFLTDKKKHLKDYHDKIKALTRLVDIVEKTKQKDCLFQIIRTMELFFEVNVKENKVWGNDNPFEKDLISDDNDLVLELLQVLNKDKERQIQLLKKKLEVLEKDNIH